MIGVQTEEGRTRAAVCAATALWAFVSGCAMHAADLKMFEIGQSSIPRELNKATVAPYRIEPPDILLIQTVKNIHLESAPLEPGDQVRLRLLDGLPPLVTANRDTAPERYEAELQEELEFTVINGEYVIGADGKLDLGPKYGSYSVAGQTLEQARLSIQQEMKIVNENPEGSEDPEKIRPGLKEPKLQMTRSSLAGKQPVEGEHLVRPDGTVGLGVYGNVFVTGMTLDEAKAAIELHLSRHITMPEVVVDVLAYNSKVIYVVMDGGGFGEQVMRIPYTGNETVLDVMSQVNGLSQVSSKRVWVARPAPGDVHRTQILDVHWSAITAEGITTTNYQVLPGDRIYVQADKLIATDNYLSKLFAPVERVFGIILLGKTAKNGGQNQN
jgi:polysaccharide biosynthesis/export protein